VATRVGHQQLSIWRRARRSLGPWAYIAPAGIIMAAISFFPQAFQIWMAFTDFTIKNLRFNLFDSATWAKFAPAGVGFQNFVRIVKSDLPIGTYDFGRILGWNLTWTFVNLIFHVSLGVGIAMALNAKRVVFRRFYRAMFVIPWALPAYVSALTWANMFNKDFGAINQLFHTNIDWLGQASLTGPFHSGILAWLPYAAFAVIIANVWLGWPFMMVVATGALQSIPHELYEAARIDGASGWQQFRYVTMPLIRPAMVPAIMLGSIWTFNQFNVIYFISQGGPLGRTEILITQAFKLVYENQLYGVAAAFSIVVFIVLLIITLAQNRITRATESYDLA
jgi:arabinogalactan oligomer / maltooligosaccharide transport system permease protein